MGWGVWYKKAVSSVKNHKAGARSRESPRKRGAKVRAVKTVRREVSLRGGACGRPESPDLGDALVMAVMVLE